MTHEDSWNQNFELLKVYIEEHHHLPDKKKVENRGLLSWAKYQRKRIKAGALDEEKTRLFLELMDSRSKEHSGGRVRKAESLELRDEWDVPISEIVKSESDIFGLEVREGR